MGTKKNDILQGTLALLVLKTLAPELTARRAEAILRE